MITCKALQANRQQFLALTGLTLSEFQRLLTAFPQAYQQLYPATQTAEGQPRQRSVGGGCKGRLEPGQTHYSVPRLRYWARTSSRKSVSSAADRRLHAMLPSLGWRFS